MKIKLLQLKGLPLYFTALLVGYATLSADVLAPSPMYTRILLHFGGVLLFVSGIVPLLKHKTVPEAWAFRLVVSLSVVSASMMAGNLLDSVAIGGHYAELALTLTSLALIGQVFWLIEQKRGKGCGVAAILIGGTLLFTLLAHQAWEGDGPWVFMAVGLYFLFVVLWIMLGVVSSMEDNLKSGEW